jgi:hypothetical protein
MIKGTVDSLNAVGMPSRKLVNARTPLATPSPAITLVNRCTFLGFTTNFTDCGNLFNFLIRDIRVIDDYLFLYPGKNEFRQSF